MVLAGVAAAILGLVTNGTAQTGRSGHMRLIDANALMKYCNKLKDKTIDANDIARFPTAVGWISVKDRLPERKEYLHESNVIRGSSEYVLVYISATFPYKRMFVTIGRYSYDEMYPRWIVRSSHDGDVTHWMPLPEPPKEVTEG